MTKLFVTLMMSLLGGHDVGKTREDACDVLKMGASHQKNCKTMSSCLSIT